MIVVDTSVWIDFLNEVPSSEAIECRRLIENDAELCTVGLILTETLQGTRSEREAAEAERTLRGLRPLGIPLPDGYYAAAELYRSARGAGVTVRSTADVLIAAHCIHHGAALLHRDRDFDQLATCSELKILRP